MWFQPGGEQAREPSPIVVLHGVTDLAGDEIAWTPRDVLTSLEKALSIGGRVTIRVHVASLFDRKERLFSAAPDTLISLKTPHVPGGIFESWIFV